MKKWMYVIFPVVLLVIFLFFYNQEMAKVAERQRETARAVAALKEASDAKKKEAEVQAKISAEKHAKEQAEADAAQLAAAESKWKSETKKIQDEIDRNIADADRFSKKSAELQIELDTLHKNKEALNREDFNLLKEVESMRINEQNSNLEIQRLVEIIARRASESAMAKMPEPAPAKKE
jgi:chromosome segregation ATPase